MPKFTALIVDDTPANIILLKHYLTMFDLACICTSSGMDAFALTQKHLPDIIFTDLLMPLPTWDGYTTIRQLKSDPTIAYIPVIAVTAAGSKVQSWSAGCDGYLQRPFSINQLRDVLNTHLKFAL